MSNIREIIGYFPIRIKKSLDEVLSKVSSQDGMILLEEIRLRSGKPIILKYTNQEQILENTILSQEEITGSVVFVDGKVANINYISSLNFRIAKQMIGASNRILKYILNIEENTVYNTLIISPPGARKNHNAS